VRRRKWVAFPDGPEVVPYLPQLLTLLAGPPYLLAMLVLFARTAEVFPGVLPTAGWLDALLLALDNFLRTQIFFDAAECFHLRLDGRVHGLPGASLVFVSRFLMDLVFIKLAVQLLNAVWFRARGLGRGQDVLFALKQEIDAGDVPRIKDLSQQVGDSLRAAVDTLCRYEEEGGDRTAMAWRCLVTLRDYALPYLKARHRAATGKERERFAMLIERLENAPATEEPTPTRSLPLLVLAAGLLVGVALTFALSGTAALAIAAVLAALASWMVAGSRGWIDRLVRWRVLAPSTPDRLARLQLRWALCLLPVLVAVWSRLLQLVAGPAPGIFSGTAGGEVNYASALVFVLENLLHTQIFVDTFQIYGLRIADLRQEGGLGGLLTFLLRLVLNLGIIALAVSFGMVWFNRVFRKFAVSPNAELALRQEADECGPQAAVLVGYHLREVRGFYLEQIRRQQDRDVLVALAASGFLKDAQADAGLAGNPLARLDLGNSLKAQGRIEEAVAEYRAAQEACEHWVGRGRGEVRQALAAIRMSLGNALWQLGRLEEATAELQGAREIAEGLVAEGRADVRIDLAKTRGNLGLALRQQGRLAEAAAELSAAREVFERLVGEGRADLRSELAKARGGLGVVLWQQGRLPESAAESQAAREVYDLLVREGREDLRGELAAARLNLGIALENQGRLVEAVAEYQAARETREQLVREGRDVRMDLARTRVNLGNALRKQGRLAEAVAEYQAAREVYERLVHEGRGDLRGDLAQARLNLGSGLGQQGRLDEAAVEYQAVCELGERLVREGRSDFWSILAMTRQNLGVTQRQQGRPEQALTELRAAGVIFERLVREGQFQLGGDLARCWSRTLEAAVQVSPQTAASVVRSAYSFLQEMLPHRAKLPPAAMKAIGDFLGAAQKVEAGVGGTAPPVTPPVSEPPASPPPGAASGPRTPPA
jgi:tetratricopeptide (TPR) repeat protein